MFEGYLRVYWAVVIGDGAGGEITVVEICDF